MSASTSARPGGQPSTTQPIAGPCDSPNDVTQNNVPNVLPDMGVVRRTKGRIDYSIRSTLHRVVVRAHLLPEAQRHVLEQQRRGGEGSPQQPALDVQRFAK